MRAQETRTWVRLVVREPIPYELRSGVCRRRAAPLTSLEFRALEKLIEGPHLSLRILREQFESVFAGECHLTGAGFFRDLQVAAEAPRVAGADQEMAVTGVGAQIPGLEHGAGFILFVREGAMCCLEGYSYGEPWPDPCEEFRLDFEGARASDPTAFRS